LMSAVRLLGEQRPRRSAVAIIIAQLLFFGCGPPGNGVADAGSNEKLPDAGDSGVPDSGSGSGLPLGAFCANAAPTTVCYSDIDRAIVVGPEDGGLRQVLLIGTHEPFGAIVRF